MFNKIWKDPVFSKIIAVAIISISAYLYELSSPVDYLTKTVNAPIWAIALGVIAFLVSLIFAIWGKGINASNGDLDLGTRSGQIKLENSICEYKYNVWAENLIDYKMKCNKCNLRMEPISTATYNFIPRFKFVCTECGNETKEYEMSQQDLFREIEKRAERSFQNN